MSVDSRQAEAERRERRQEVDAVVDRLFGTATRKDNTDEVIDRLNLER